MYSISLSENYDESNGVSQIAVRRDTDTAAARATLIM